MAWNRPKLVSELDRHGRRHPPHLNDSKHFGQCSQQLGCFPLDMTFNDPGQLVRNGSIFGQRMVYSQFRLNFQHEN